MINKILKNNIALTGGFAVGEAIRQINPDVMAVYPITPQTPIIEYVAKKVADGKIDTEIITVESEHSAMSACIGAAAAGARTMTASSSQGIMYMMEMLPIASSMRLPIVMAVANRAISGPLNIHGDHSDAMAMRDFGWIQIFAETVQEAYDNTFIALKTAEQAMLPATTNLDGFFTSHSVENIDLLETESIRKFIGEYKPEKHLLDFENPITMGSLVLPNAYFEFKKQIFEAMNQSRSFFNHACHSFAEISGRDYQAIEAYQTVDAETIVVAIGSVCGTIKDVVDQLREKGQKVGLLKIRLFRPFPYADVAKFLEKITKIIVLDRNMANGTNQVLAAEVEHAIGKKVQSIIYGLGGREVYEEQIKKILTGKFKGQMMM